MRFRIERYGLHEVVDVLDPWASIPKDAFDVVVAMDVIEHLQDAEEMLRERLLPALKGAGVFVENSPFEPTPTNPMHHEDFGLERLLAGHGSRRPRRSRRALASGDPAARARETAAPG